MIGRTVFLSRMMTLILFGAGCSQQKLNERDVKRNQEVASAEALRAEYLQVAGVYDGELLGTDGYRQDVILRIAVQDVPVVVEGQTDPILTPKLTGSLRFLLGNEDAGEYTDAAIDSAEYISSRKQLNLVVNHSQFSKMILNSTHNEPTLSGNWSAASVGISGTSTLQRRL